MTEDEAKTRWCPFARAEDGEPPVSVNRPAPYGDVPKCLGSFCMAWRWDDTFTSSTEEGVGGDMVLRLKRKAGEPRQGYCGLAGTPGMP